MKNSQFVAVGFRSLHPERAAQVANALVDAYIEQVRELRTSASARTGASLGSETEDQARGARDAEEALQTYAEQQGLANLEDRRTLLSQRLADLSDARVGCGCIVNTAAVVEHDCRLDNWAHLSPRAILGGGASLCEGAHVGLGAVVLPGMAPGSWAILGAGAVMTRCIPPGVTAVGVPARALCEPFVAPGGR